MSPHLTIIYRSKAKKKAEKEQVARQESEERMAAAAAAEMKMAGIVDDEGDDFDPSYELKVKAARKKTNAKRRAAKRKINVIDE